MYQSSSKRGRQPYLAPLEAKRRRLERYRERRKRLINIATEITSWLQLKDELSLANDAYLAKFLINYYRSHSASMQLDARREAIDHKSKDESNSASPTSSSGNQSEQPAQSPPIGRFPRRTTPHLLSAVGFINTELRDCTVEEEVLNIINNEEISREEEFVPVSIDPKPEKSLHSMRTGIVFDTCLMSLAKKAFSRCECPNCNGKIDLKLHLVATAMKVVSHCCHGHESTWWSQPLLEGVPAGNIQLASSIVLSGNNYRKIALMLKFLNMLPVGHQSFLEIQKSHVRPSVTSYWKKMQGEHFLELTHPIVVLGDQCNKSRALSEKYLTYAMMDNSTHKILDVQVTDIRKGARKLRNLESSGFQRAFQCLVQNGLNVSEMVTDADPWLLSIMKSKYPRVLHQVDLRHGIRAVHERLAKVTASSDNKDLQPWIRDIISHFMYCCQHSHGDTNTLMSRWRSILHHTVNMHEWQLGDGSTAARCEHGPLADKEVKDKKWLKAGSPAHRALREVVYDKWLTSNLNYFVQARVISELESFNNHILMYAAKNFTYDYHRMYSKRTKDRRAVPIKLDKQYRYFEGLREDILKANPPKCALRQQPKRLGAKTRRNAATTC